MDEQDLYKKLKWQHVDIKNEVMYDFDDKEALQFIESVSDLQNEDFLNEFYANQHRCRAFGTLNISQVSG